MDTMVLRILEEPIDEPIEPVNASIPLRLAGCAVAWLVAFMPAITAGSSTYRLVVFLRSMVSPEKVPSKAAILSILSNLNVPLVIGLCISALVAFAFALALAFKPRFRLASVGFPSSIGILIMAAAPALLLLIAENYIVDVLNLTVRSSSAEVSATARTISELLFAALGLSVLTVPASFVAPFISLLVSPQSRSEPLSQHRVMVWLCGAVLLLVLAGAYMIVF
jgi:hypothetical protein